MWAVSVPSQNEVSKETLEAIDPDDATTFDRRLLHPTKSRLPRTRPASTKGLSASGTHRHKCGKRR